MILFNIVSSCYGNLFCFEKDENVVINGWAVFWSMIVVSNDKEWFLASTLFR